MSDVILDIRPERDEDAERAHSAATVEVAFTRTFDAVDAGQDQFPSEGQDVTRVTLDGFKATATLRNVVGGSAIDLLFLADSALPKLVKRVQAPPNDGALEVALSAADIERLVASDPMPPAPPATVAREATFVSVGTPVFDFRVAKLEVAPVDVAQEWQTAGLAELFHSQTPMTAAIEMVAVWPGYGHFSWSPTHVGVDGAFTTSFPRGSGDGWMWWLTGTQSALGVVLDDLSAPGRRRIAIALPPFAQPPTVVPDSGRVTPANVTERELADNPEIYAEDPGQFCKPFQNPERVLGERRFNVILRAEQPSIGPDATIRGSSFSLLDVETRVNGTPGRAVLDRVIGALRAGADRATSRSVGRGIAGFNTTVVHHALPRPYLDLLNRYDRGRRHLDGPDPVQWEGDAFRYQAATVARGHILEYSLRWRSNGYSLGTVASTLTLAPRQAKRIQKVEWARRERSERRERTRLVDEVEDEVTRARDYEDEVRASLSEWARGESRSSMTAAAGGFGVAGTGFVIGGGGGHSNASSSSSQSGGRRAVASEEQRLRDTTRRYAESLRQLESVVVSEVSQEESVTGTTEIIRNFNYAHSLTVIYYQILRHLKVETAFTGVRECVFVPFAISPFTLLRAYRWRESIRGALRDQRYAPALRNLGDVVTNFAQSDIPAGRRSDQPIRHISGSLFLTVGIERPFDKDDGGFDDPNWLAIKPFLGGPAFGIHARLKAVVESQRDRQFQQEHAPRIAANWVDTLQISASGQPLPADFTLATRYQFNGQVRVDFSIPMPAGQVVTREMLSSLRVRATNDLTPGSVANLTRVTLEYQTDWFRRSLGVSQGVGDLVNVSTGALDPGGAVVSAPPDPWERRDERLEMIRAAQDLVQHLNENIEHYHKAIWWNMDRDRIFMLLDGFFLPSAPGVSVASVIERDPIAIVGNSLVFRVSAGSFLGINAIKTPEALHQYYASGDATRTPLYISLPTDGLYAQTIMDECNALEEYYGNQDWVLAQADLELGAMAPELLASRRATPEPTVPTPFPETIINLQNAPEAPAPAGLAGVLAAITNANAFRDMAGLAGTQVNARAAFESAAGLAAGFGANAAALKLAELAGKAQAAQSADQKLATIKKAADRQLVSTEEAQQHAAKVLEDLYSPSTTGAPHEDREVAEAIRRAAGATGSQIEATTPEGQVRVMLASNEPAPVAERCGFFDRAGRAIGEATVRVEVVDVARAERDFWVSAAGQMLRENAASQFGHLIRYWLEERQTVPRENLTAIATAAQDPATNYGQLLGPATVAATDIDAERRRVAADLIANVPDPRTPPNLERIVQDALADARASRLNSRAWSGAFINACVRVAEFNLELEGPNTGGAEALLALSRWGRHWEYTLEAHRRRFGCRQTDGSFNDRCRRDGTYHAFRPNERAIREGDIIIQDRRDPLDVADVWRFDRIPNLTGLDMHGDIVVDLQPGFAETIGGNVSNSASRRRYPLDADGMLIVDRLQRFVAETQTQTFPALPVADPGGDPLHEQSTARILAVLSVVEECIAIPGQPVPGGMLV